MHMCYVQQRLNVWSVIYIQSEPAAVSASTSSLSTCVAHTISLSHCHMPVNSLQSMCLAGASLVYVHIKCEKNNKRNIQGGKLSLFKCNASTRRCLSIIFNSMLLCLDSIDTTNTQLKASNRDGRKNDNNFIMIYVLHLIIRLAWQPCLMVNFLFYSILNFFSKQNQVHVQTEKSSENHYRRSSTQSSAVNWIARDSLSTQLYVDSTRIHRRWMVWSAQGYLEYFHYAKETSRSICDECRREVSGGCSKQFLFKLY